MEKIDTKQKVMNAACQLFYLKGYHGTSVRDIAGKASVNVSLINYYYKSKQGLLESSVIDYYETYLAILDSTVSETEGNAAIERLQKLIEAIIQYKLSSYQFTCFIQRELMIDSVFVREMAVTYLAKESHILKQAFSSYLASAGVNRQQGVFLYIQLQGMIAAPFTSGMDMKNYLITQEAAHYFIKSYTSSIASWLRSIGTKKQTALRAVSLP